MPRYLVTRHDDWTCSVVVDAETPYEAKRKVTCAEH